MKKFFKFVKWFFVITLLIVVGAGIGVGIFFYPKLSTMYADANYMVSNIKENTFKSSQTSLIYDSSDKIIAKLKGEKDTYYLSSDEITDFTKEAFIATEDKNFKNHIGIDIKGISRAAVNLVRNSKISGGGSTITQQLARNIFLTHEVTYERKIKEIFIALLLEKSYGKDLIMEYYVNSIYFSNGTYGIEAASRKFFSKPSSKLTLAETVFLCAIPNNPSLYNPITKYDNTIKRQQRMLKYMLEDGYITNKEYEKALKEEIKLKVEEDKKNNFIDTYVLHSATETLMKINGFEFKNEFKNDREKEKYDTSYNEVYSNSQKDLYTGGYRIYTSIDMAKQKKLQQAIDNELKGFTKKNGEGIYAFQGAATTIDNATGKVVAIVGGRGQEVSGYTINRAFQSFRQPGSSFKPLIVYTPAFEKGYLPSSMMNDAPIANGPKNANGNFEGPMNIRTAVMKSTNTVAWDMLNRIGPKTGLDYVRKMGFQKIVSQDNTLSSALGGITYGVSTLEMASAYSAIARDGYFYDPTCIVKITDANGKVLYNDNEETIKIYTTKASRIMTNVLESVISGGTAASLKLSNMTAAAKTGSTNDSKDGWFAGFTPYYTTVVWVGYDIPQKTPGLFGSTYPGRIWKNYMTEIHKGLEAIPFKKYDGLQEEEDALNKLIQEEEAKKVLIDEIESELEIFLNKDINTMTDVNALYGLHSSLTDKINKLKDEEEKKSYIEKINARKTTIDAKNEELKLLEPPVVEEPAVTEPLPTPTPEVTPVEPTAPITESPSGV